MIQAEPLFAEFFYLLQDYGLEISLQYVLDLNQAIEHKMIRNLDELFVMLRLLVVKRVEQMDAFERAFAFYFFGIDIPDVAEGDPALLYTRQFQQWLSQAIERNQITGPIWQLDRDELMRKFWQTLREQLEKHDGGSKWIGTGGSSPFGHSGMAQPGVRVFGPGGNRSAIKAIGDRSYIDYADSHSLSGSNIRQALAALKQLKPSGAPTDLDIDQTIYQTTRNGGEIELIFQKELRDKISVILLIDNGGSSMLPHVELTRLLFAKLKDRFKELKCFYFHNTIYAQVFCDPGRRQAFPTEKLLQSSRETRLMILGDASMAPEELVSPYGSMSFEYESPEPSTYWLQRLRERFVHSVWLNPIPREHWNPAYGTWTLNQIREIFPMHDLTLKGIKEAVDDLNH